VKDIDELFTLTNVMESNNGVLRRRDHPASRGTLAVLLRSGAIVRILPGVFIDADRVRDRRTRCAAALAASPRSVLWGEQAAAAHRRTLNATEFGEEEQVLLAHEQARRAGHGVRWVRRRIPAEHRSRIDGLRCPSARFLAVEASARDGGALIERFLRDRLIKPDELAGVLASLSGSAGQDARRRIVRISVDNPWSGGERGLHQLLRDAALRGWEANPVLAIDGRSYYPDLLFRTQRLVVEFDGYEIHSRPDVFEADRARQNALVEAGYQVLRYTWKQLTGRPDAVVRQLRAVLARQMTTDSANLDA